jgi:hypothetical protein
LPVYVSLDGSEDGRDGDERHSSHSRFPHYPCLDRVNSNDWRNECNHSQFCLRTMKMDNANLIEMFLWIT